MSTLGNMILEGNFSALPTAGIPGRLYFATDTGAQYRDNGTSWDNVSPAGSGTVTSVGLAVPSRQTASGSPVTGSGTITVSDNVQPASDFFAGPTSGSPAAPTFRAIVPADLPVTSSTAFGAAKVDGTSITATAGVISAAPTALPSGSGNQVVATPNGSSGTASLRALVPADLPTATTGAKGAVQPDGTSITIVGSVISAVGTGSVSSVGMTVPSRQTVTGSPVTGSGTLAIIDNVQSSNVVFAGPPSGTSTAPTFRALVPLDLPVGTSSALGAVQPDGTTIVVTSGMISAPSPGLVGTVVDGGGSTPTTGIKGFIQIPYNATITQWTLLADTTGSAVFDVKKSTFSSYPTVASIVASAPPTLSTQQKASSTTLTGWTTSVTAGDVIEFVLSSVSTVTYLTLTLVLKRT